MTQTEPHATDRHFLYAPDPDLPGWHRWQLRDESRYNAFLGPLHVRLADDGSAIVRMTAERGHSNLADHIHGGVLLGFMDVALFAAARAMGVLGAGGAVTLDLSAQFIAGGALGEPVEARVELLRETGRLLFQRGLVVQGDRIVASFTGTVRKGVAAS